MEDFSSIDSINSIVKVSETRKPEQLHTLQPSQPRCCNRAGNICWSLVLMVACLVVGFVGGMVFGDQKSRSDYDIAIKEAQKAEPCIQQVTNPNYTAVCSVCSRSSLLSVEKASNVDCNGLYSFSSATNKLDSIKGVPTVVFVRIAGGWSQNKRFIYWNKDSGWGIGDFKDTFHKQAVPLELNHPWLVSWPGNMSVSLTSCQLPSPNI